jgi:hypothetical protein
MTTEILKPKSSRHRHNTQEVQTEQKCSVIPTAMRSQEQNPSDTSDVSDALPFETDYLDGASEIAKFLGPAWTERKVYHARETNALPIRRKRGLGLYAFRSELVTALKDPVTLTPQA